jgi:anaerobic C4-dicarboxylate transporter DcuB
MLKYAEKLLRKNPQKITVLAPITTWFLTVLCGTGHVVYTMFPIIYDIAIKQNIRPERPMAVASVASQMGICASPASVAVVSMVAMLANTSHPLGVVQILIVSIPATFCGVVVAGLWSLKRGKDLDKDPVFQAKLADPEQQAYIYEEQQESVASMKLPATAYKATFIFLAGIVVIALFGSFPKELLPLVPNAKGIWEPLSMTPTIQLCMLVIAAIILLVCKVKVNDVTNGSVFKSGMVAVVSVYGVAWMAETYFGAYLPGFKKTLGQIVTQYPWTYAVVLFLISKLVNSQAAALAIVVPMALSVGVNPLIIISFISACYGYFVLPTYPSDLACIGFDRSGTTRIGKYVINHSFILPGLIGVATGCCVGYVIAHILY